MKKVKRLAAALFAAVFTATFFAATACGKDDAETVSVYMPDGAPALALAKQMSEDTEDDGTEYHVVESSMIQAYVTGDAPQADVCVLPVNLASKLLGTGEIYRMLGTVTHGNLYMLSSDNGVCYTAENLSGLIGKTVGVVQLQNVPGLTFKTILDEILGADKWQELGNDLTPVADKVNLRAISSAGDVAPTEGIDVFVAPEPAASLKVSKTELEFIGDLQSLYGGEKGYPQAVLVAKTQFISQNTEWINNFTSSLAEGISWLETTQISTIVEAVSSHLTPQLTPSFTAANLTPTVISHCGIRFESAADAKEEINAFLAKLIAVDAKAAATVADAFYYV